MRPLQRVTVNGNSFLVRAGTCDEVVINDDYHAERGVALVYEPRGGDLVVDAGAHIGSFAIPLATRCPGLDLIALEPDAESFELLERNLVINHLANVLAVQSALTSETGMTTLYAGVDSWGHTTERREAGGEYAREQRVPAIALECLATAYRIRRISLLKINIEGGEYGVLLGASKTVLDRIDRIWVEFHPHHLYEPAMLVDRLDAAGFRSQLRASKESGKGWIAAVRHAGGPCPVEQGSDSSDSGSAESCRSGVSAGSAASKDYGNHSDVNRIIYQIREFRQARSREGRLSA